MTEEIIIDGVDVAGCQYLFDDTSYKRSKTSCSINLGDCKKRPIGRCYYKQLKRLEQENKELKEGNELLRDSKFKELDRALEAEDKYKSALEKIRAKVNQSYQMADRHIVLNIINEVLE